MVGEIVKPITIEEEYKKNPDISPDEIKKLREWLKTQPHLPEKHLTGMHNKLHRALAAWLRSTKSISKVISSNWAGNLHFLIVNVHKDSPRKHPPFATS